MRQLSTFPVAKVLYIKDGDTVFVAVGQRQITIRLDSIDCPEDDQPWGDIACAGLIKLIGGKTVALEEHGYDGHGRTLATLYVRIKYGTEWMNVNERMLLLGHAWVMNKYFDHLPESRQAKLYRLQRWARSEKVGLWNTLNPVPLGGGEAQSGQCRSRTAFLVFGASERMGLLYDGRRAAFPARLTPRPATRQGIRSMIFDYLVPIAVGAVALVLLMGLWNMLRGGSANRSQTLMRWRVVLQFVAIVIMMAALWFASR
ncbi:MAG: twin transmembrane helix small protein [Rhizobiales bacterium]|nr:twin transmembrane helix small protein [Hyphomicrobiales bacterium]